MFTRISSILRTRPGRSKTANTFIALQVRQEARGVLDKVLSEYPTEVARAVKVKSFKNGTLNILSPTLLSAELHTRSEGLKEAINKALGKDLVWKIRFRAG